MPVNDRNSAVQGEVVRLFRTFVSDGGLTNLNVSPTVEIVDAAGTLLDTLDSSSDSIGVYYADWTVPVDLEIGRYHDRWSYSYDGLTTLQGTSYFTVITSDTWLSFAGSNTSSNISDRMATMIRALENDFIYEAQHIPVYWEQGIHTASSEKMNFAYGNWRDDPKPIVRLNGKIIQDGWIADYDKGEIFFETPPSDTDDITATYTFSYFSHDELAGFIGEGLRAMNSVPPVESYRNVNQVPAYWDYGILLMAAVHAMRRLVMGLNFQERAIIFGEDPERARAAQSNFQQLYQDYSALWKEISAGIKKALPQTGMVIIPEYTLPGGRARWYRYLYTTGAGS